MSAYQTAASVAIIIWGGSLAGWAVLGIALRFSPDLQRSIMGTAPAPVGLERDAEQGRA